jgi:hypothetical protein
MPQLIADFPYNLATLRRGNHTPASEYLCRLRDNLIVIPGTGKMDSRDFLAVGRID